MGLTFYISSALTSLENQNNRAGHSMSKFLDTLAHMNSSELDVLDYIQGASHRLHGNENVRLYNKEMEELLGDPKVSLAILSFARRHYAKGGRVGVEKLSNELLEKYRLAGRNGDNCMAIIGPRLKGLLDILANHKGTTNPETQCPEYFSLGGMFSSIGSGLKSFGSAALPMLGQLAGGALGARFGGPAGMGMGSQLGGMLGQVGSNMLGGGSQNSGEQPNAWQSAGQNAAQAAQNMYNGMPAQEAMGGALQNYGQQNFGNNSFGNGLTNAASSLMQGQSPSQAFNSFQEGGGLNPMMESARNAYQSIAGGGMPQQMGGYGQQMINEGQGYGQNMMDRMRGYGEQLGGYGQQMMNNMQGYGQQMMDRFGGMPQQMAGYGQQMMNEGQGYGQQMGGYMPRMMTGGGREAYESPYGISGMTPSGYMPNMGG